MDLHLDRTMLTAALDGLRGPLRLRLADPKITTEAIIFPKNRKSKLFLRLFKENREKTRDLYFSGPDGEKKINSDRSRR